MSVKAVWLALLGAVAVVTAGCVERKLLIRSDPSPAPVWVDEVYCGQTPLDYPFAHYGPRRIRVGPLRDEEGKLTHHEVERVVDVNAPWYETFPIDFFFEVLYPKTLRDVHELPVFILPRPSEGSVAVGQGTIDRVRTEAEAFRQKALTAIPEAEGG